MATSSSDSLGTPVDDPGLGGVFRRPPSGRHDRLVHRGKRRAGLQDGDHAGVERQAHVGLGHAPVAAADPHQPQVVRDDELRAARRHGRSRRATGEADGSVPARGDEGAGRPAGKRAPPPVPAPSWRKSRPFE